MMSKGDKANFGSLLSAYSGTVVPFQEHPSGPCTGSSCPCDMWDLKSGDLIPSGLPLEAMGETLHACQMCHSGEQP